MDKQSKDLYSDAVRAEVRQRYGIAPDKIKLLDGFENFIYEYETNDTPRILRVSHDLHRTSNAINGEIEWINYLADGGVSVPRALPSPNGHLVEVVEAADGSHFSAVSFTKAEGKYHWECDDSPPDLNQQMGRMMGKMHALTKTFSPSDPAFKRPEWYEENENFAEKYLPPGDEIIEGKFGRLTRALRSLPQDNDSYGLVHFDFHSMNFFVHNSKITLFDFDDCQYHWFAADVAIALFYAISHDCTTPEELAKAKKFFGQFMEGYSAENTFEDQWLQYIPMFLKQREIDLYIAIHRSLDVNNLDPWAASFMADRKKKIVKDVPYAAIF